MTRGQFGFSNVVLVVFLLLVLSFFYPVLLSQTNAILNKSATDQTARVLFMVIPFFVIGAIGLNLARNSSAG